MAKVAPKKPIKAETLIRKLKAIKRPIKPDIDYGDLIPKPRSAYAGISDHRCYVTGVVFEFPTDSCTRGIDWGDQCATVCGIEFHRSFSDCSSLEFDRSAIDFGDGDEEKICEEIRDAAYAAIDFEGYDADRMLEIAIKTLSDDDLRGVVEESFWTAFDELDAYDGLGLDEMTFAIDKAGEVCLFGPRETIPKKQGFRRTTYDKAIDRLCTSRDFEYSAEV